ncbi:MAG: hypothetical protein QNK37_02375 [Acidobacteriota bacterium]|nr:hypothetical protein [Acidobacteriota bacterium]
MDFIDGLDAPYMLLAGCGLLLIATQLVVAVLNTLEKRDFGTVQLGTLVTPLCTGYPNLMLGLFGQERLQGDLVLQLNLGNNIANASLVVGLILFAAGPISVRAGKGKSKKARKANQTQALAFAFLWLGALLLFFLALDGRIDRIDGLYLTVVYVLYQVIALRGRGKVSKKKRLGFPLGLLMLLLLGIAAWLIQQSIDAIAGALDKAGGLLPGMQLGLFLGLLTVLPESFLLLRLAWSKGSLGLSGLVGDCLVSVPLVIGLSAMLTPFETPAPLGLFDASTRPYLILGVCMAALTLLAASAKAEVPRRVGLLFMLGYGLIWWMTS